MLLVNKVCVSNMIDLTSVVLEKLTSHYFSQLHAYGSQFALYVKRSIVNLGSSFEQNLEASSSQCFLPSLKVPSSLVLEKKILNGFLPYMGHGSHLGQQTGTT